MVGGVCPQYPNQLRDGPLFTGLVTLGSGFLHSVECYTHSPNHSHAPASSLEVGQKLWLCLRCDFLCKRLWIGPFIIQTVIDPVASRLKLPRSVCNCSNLSSVQGSASPWKPSGPCISTSLPHYGDSGYSVRSGLEREMGQKRPTGSCLDYLLWRETF